MNHNSIILLVFIMFIAGVMVGIAFDLANSKECNSTSNISNETEDLDCVKDLAYCTESLNSSTKAFNDYINLYCK